MFKITCAIALLCIKILINHSVVTTWSSNRVLISCWKNLVLRTNMSRSNANVESDTEIIENCFSSTSFWRNDINKHKLKCEIMSTNLGERSSFPWTVQCPFNHDWLKMQLIILTEWRVTKWSDVKPQIFKFSYRNIRLKILPNLKEQRTSYLFVKLVQIS